MNMIGMKFDDVDGEEPMPVPPARTAAFGIGVWKTREGRKAEVRKDKDCVLRRYDLTGVIHFGNQAVGATWTKNGDFFPGKFHGNDLMGPWVAEAPVVEAPVAEAPVVEAPVVEAPVAEAPKFGVGVWKTRNGSRVHVDRTDGKEPFVLLGKIGPDPDSINCRFSWTIDGKFKDNGDHSLFDLIEPWPQETPETPEDLYKTWEVEEANDAIKTLTAQLQVADRKTVHLEGELASMAVLLRDAVKEGEEHKQTANDRTAELLAANQRIAVIEKGLVDIKADRCWFKNLSEEQQRKIKSQQQTIDAQIQTIESWSRAAREKDKEIERLRKTLGREMDSNIEEADRLNKVIADLREENVVQGFKLSAAIDERETEKLKAKLDLDALQAATEQKQNIETLPAIRRLKVLMLACRFVTVLLLAAIPLAGQWISQHGPGWMVDSSGQGTLGPGTLFAAFIAWLGICFIGATIEGEIHRTIQYKVAPERRQDW